MLLHYSQPQRRNKMTDFDWIKDLIIKAYTDSADAELLDEWIRNK
jgi:hypothetical protein